MTSNVLQTYQQIGVNGQLEDAGPHELIRMLFRGLLDRLASARVAIGSGDVALQGQEISRAIAIVDGLRASIDQEAGGEIAGNLVAIYDFLETYLIEANIEGDSEKLGIARSMVLELTTAWEAIPGEQHALPA